MGSTFSIFTHVLLHTAMDVFTHNISKHEMIYSCIFTHHNYTWEMGHMVEKGHIVEMGHTVQWGLSLRLPSLICAYTFVRRVVHGKSRLHVKGIQLNGNEHH